MAVILVGGGSRSGKTGFALRRAKEHGARLAYVATAQALDGEMEDRVAAHQAERGEEFVTIEEPYDLAGVVERRAAGFDAMVIDCLTLWLSNLMLNGSWDVPHEVGRLIEAARENRCRLVFVTNEVGAGIVPDNELSRRFRDQAGWMNQQMASIADEVYWTVFGCPLKVK